jgi:Domain of unknown function (DUF222)
MYDRRMLEALAEAVTELVIAPSAEQIEKALWLRERLDAKISRALRDFDEAEGWRQDGSLSLTAWLAAHGRASRKEAHREAVIASRLASLPVTEGAWADGTLSSGQTAAIVANVCAERAALYAEHEAEMTPVLAELSVAETAVAMRSWRLHAEAQEDGRHPAEHPSALHLSQTLDGRRELVGHLAAVDAAIVEAAIAQAMGDRSTRPIPAEGPLPTAAQRRAEALVDLCRWFLDHYDEAPTGARQRPHLSVIVRLQDLATGAPGQLADGTPIAGPTVSQLACDAELHRIVMSGRSTILDYGSAVRTVSPALWAALVVRDGHCRHPGCDRPPAWCEAHHIQYASRAGPTRLSNLVLACSRHHHLWHSQGWQLQLGSDGGLKLKSPRGLVLTSGPRAAQLVV